MNTFDHIINGKARPARRVTKGTLDGWFGPDRGRALIVSLEGRDMIVFRPKGTRQRLEVGALDLFKLVYRRTAFTRAMERRRNQR